MCGLFVSQCGVKFDPESAQTLRLEFARSNTKMTRPRQLFPAAVASATPIPHVLSPAAPAYIHPFATRKYPAYRAPYVL